MKYIIREANKPSKQAMRNLHLYMYELLLRKIERKHKNSKEDKHELTDN